MPPAVIYDKRPDGDEGETSLTKSKLFDTVDDPEQGDDDGDASSDSTGVLEGGGNDEDDIEESPTFHQTRKPSRQSEFVGKWPTLPTHHTAIPTMPTMPTMPNMPSVYHRNKKN